MIKLFVEGGPLFMGMLTLVLFIVLIMAVVKGMEIKNSETSLPDDLPDPIKSLGLFAFVLGMLGQFLGLYAAFDVISQGVEITPEMFAAGLRVSSITSIYGMIIFLISYLLWFALKALMKKQV